MAKLKESRVVEIDDMSVQDCLSGMPDEILLSIMSRFTMTEAARLSLVSRRCQFMWRCFPFLIFEDSNALVRMNVARSTVTSQGRLGVDQTRTAVSQERLGFVEWVNFVLEQHLGATIEELRVTFDLDRSWQSNVDKWVDFAIRKRVKVLELNFEPLWKNKEPPKLSSISSSLTSVYLKRVDVSDEFIDNLVNSCMSLESLCIVDLTSLTRISAASPSTLRKLKHLHICRCYNLKTINICAPQLCSFTHYGLRIQDQTCIYIADAFSLSKVSIGDIRKGSWGIPHEFYSLSQYFSQLEYLTLMLGNPSIHNESYLDIDHPPILTNLKHLELRIFANSDPSILGLTCLFAASPDLQKLSLKFVDNKFGTWYREKIKKNGNPLKSLKTLEIVGYRGLSIDLEFAYYVFENSTVLEEVIVEFVPLLVCNKIEDEKAEKRLVKLQKSKINCQGKQWLIDP